MSWSTSNRRARLPKDWPHIRARILKRDGHRCTWLEHGQRCKAKATDVDHIKAGDDHRDSNLTSLCDPHHRAKSAREGAAARNAAPNPRHRTPPPHPGLMQSIA